MSTYPSLSSRPSCQPWATSDVTACCLSLCLYIYLPIPTCPSGHVCISIYPSLPVLQAIMSALGNERCNRVLSVSMSVYLSVPVLQAIMSALGNERRNHVLSVSMSVYLSIYLPLSSRPSCLYIYLPILPLDWIG